MYNYDTVTEAIQGLKRRGYTLDFNAQADAECLVCHDTSLNLSPEEFQIDEVYRFEGNSDPGDEMVVYAISSERHNAKGVVINAFGTYSDGTVAAIVKHLHRHHTSD
ncbi:MAG: phosphoribosylpyrophosphate synthetase [Flavobacteriales bacterium]|nr:phosphoribosylpyrophosphate synthetase [Flavobacteriales bacterium]MBK7298234.1 phosphoribosylpyrophosphate synthetase [Flavobacteriales bacterium]MBK9534139.1 phosphoribosylpyrophosphate synthetase [Flavobacteriales bacterium]HQV53539.1 phosphoribosylpyrophosphate synthetase [Flavobacteriales bacterium]HQX31437.1 phosphoribosylpyrophosphate synthetase [Flavobacteriales bacterium]